MLQDQEVDGYHGVMVIRLVSTALAAARTTLLAGRLRLQSGLCGHITLVALDFNFFMLMQVRQLCGCSFLIFMCILLLRDYAPGFKRDADLQGPPSDSAFEFLSPLSRG